MAREIGLAIAMLVEAFNVKEITPVRIKIYEKAMEAWPKPVIEPAVMRAIQQFTSKVKDWLPSIEQLNECAEAVRLEMRAAMAYAPCASCELTPGWVSVTHDGCSRMKRCECWQAHQQRVQQLGVGNQPLALPPAASKDFTAVGDIE